MKFSLTKNDSADIGLASTALTAGAISFEEFQSWINFVVEHAEDPPHYIFDLMDWDRTEVTFISQVIGWWPSADLKDAESDALVGIGFIRNLRGFDDHLSREEAIAILQANIKVVEQMRALMPFIDWDREVPIHAF
ncbi:hypothetical protein [Shimia marina]|uniref:Uncharacterized protein n=1 Tax=Shimia marina TaxID=321267 RepID=A0A0P1EMW8_9RHOB|nr:hypothetical protein [Shimia marina]CUH51562.1 hypothetical protein SHM7688_00999 [Shimia marina]SFD45977.1 hypothetical protein SAMN04488037_101107 [Shimia marina]